MRIFKNPLKNFVYVSILIFILLLSTSILLQKKNVDMIKKQHLELASIEKSSAKIEQSAYLAMTTLSRAILHRSIQYHEVLYYNQVIQNAQIDFDMYLDALQFGTESENFKHSKGGINYLIWGKNNLDKTIKISEKNNINTQIIENIEKNFTLCSKHINFIMIALRQAAMNKIIYKKNNEDINSNYIMEQYFLAEKYFQLTIKFTNILSEEASIFSTASVYTEQVTRMYYLAVSGFVLMLFFILSSVKIIAAYQKKLSLIQHRSGMAEIASDVVHNIGNVLNSVNVTTLLLEEEIVQSKVLQMRHGIDRLLLEHGDDLALFINTAPGGKQFPQYLKLLSETIGNENSQLLQEVEGIKKHIEHIVNIVSSQQEFASPAGLFIETDIVALIEDALNVNLNAEYQEKIKIIRQFTRIRKVSTDKIKLLQILTNLIKNAIDSLMLSAESDKRIVISIKEKDDRNLMIQVKDTGVGISPENINKIFSYGFTTKKQGHGFGLHSSGNFMNKIGGSISAESEGIGKGALFTLTIPYKTPERD